MPTVIVIDTSCLKHLRRTDARVRLRRQLRLIDAVPLPSIVNVIEVVNHPTPSYRRELLRVIEDLASDYGLAPWPYSLMERVARSVLAGRASFDLESLGVGTLLQAPISQGLQDTAKQEAATIERPFAAMMTDARSRIRKFLKARGIANEWSAARDFLDRFWMRPEQIDYWISTIWRVLGLPDPPRCDAMRINPTWRMFLEGYGLAAFERTFVANQPRPFGQFDLLQLLYVTGFRQSIFVTDEVPLRRATDVLFERVRGARALTYEEFADP